MGKRRNILVKKYSGEEIFKKLMVFQDQLATKVLESEVKKLSKEMNLEKSQTEKLFELVNKEAVSLNQDLMKWFLNQLPEEDRDDNKKVVTWAKAHWGEIWEWGNYELASFFSEKQIKKINKEIRTKDLATWNYVKGVRVYAFDMFGDTPLEVEDQESQSEVSVDGP